MAVCTGKGDKGFSSLSSGAPICKSELCFDVLGNIDELSAALGLAKAAGAHKETLEGFQRTLINIMSYVSCRDERFLLTSHDAEIVLAHSDITLKEFILPGKDEKSARLDFARTVARRAERSYIRLHRREGLDENAIVFLNRLSDALFVMENE